MNHSLRLHPLLIAGMLLTLSASTSAVQVNFDDKGLSALNIDANNRLVSGTPGIWRIRGTGDAPIASKQSGSTFDAASRTLTITYNWGTMRTRYEPLPQGVRLHITITNTGNQIINELNANLLSVSGLGEGTRISRPTYGIEGPPFVQAAGPDGAVVLSAASQDKPLQLQLHEDKNSLSARIGLGGERIIVDNVTAAYPIAPGETAEFTTELRLGGAGSDPLVLAEDFVAAYRAAHPRTLNWPDRRPILRLFFGGGLPKEQALANLQNPDAIQPPPPDTKFREHVLGRMRSTVQTAKHANAQAVIFWDLEGETFPHAVTYIGDPRLIRVLNPQMDLVIDEAIKILHDGGLNVGITLRPSRVVYNEEKKTAAHSHTVAADPFLELDGKIQYARDRWGLRVFYIDTNFFWRPYGAEQKWQSGQIAPDVWQRLQAKYPDTLFIPEFGNYADYPYTAPYGEADMGNYTTPELVRALWPEAFRVIVIEDADPYANYDRFVGTVREGNALMTYAFSPDAPNLVAAMRIYQEADLLRAPVPSAVEKTSGEALAGLLRDEDLATRFHAARKLGQQPNPAMAADLLKRVQDEQEQWVVRNGATQALAGATAPQAIEPLVNLLTDRKLGLYAAATRALAGQGQPAIAPVAQRLEAEVTGGKPDVWAVEALGDALVALKAQDQAQRLMDLYGKVPEGRGSERIRRALLEPLGRLGNPAAEAFLLQRLQEEPVREAAATALVRMDSQRGREEIKSMLEEAKQAKNSSTVEQLNRALRAR